MRFDQKAFTLVEMMVVVGIIAILAAIALPNLLKSKISANDASAKATLKSVANALETYYASNNSYPPDPTSLTGAAPPYLNKNYFTGNYNGFSFTFSTTDSTYTVTATPVAVGQTGSTTFTISTGGVLAP